MSAAVGALGARLRNAITPECANLSKTIKLSALILLILITVMIVILLSALAYNHMKKTTGVGLTEAEEVEEEAKKTKVISSLSSTNVGVMAMALVASIWLNSSAAKTAKTCLT